MLRLVLSVVSGLLFSANAWAIPQPTAKGDKLPALQASTLGVQLCLLLQDPWQDCADEPPQLQAVAGAGDLFFDPWQDGDDPWQPFPAAVPAATTPDSAADPWQPLVSQLVRTSVPAVTPALAEDPWQPVPADGEDDPWQRR